MVETVQVVGAGRVGSAIAARLAQRGVELGEDGAELVLLCVPDTAIADAAARIESGPWVGHVSGATPLAALEPHERRFGLHPLQTFTRDRGPEQLDGAWAAVTAETEEAQTVATWLAETLGLRPFPLSDDARGGPPGGREPLMRRTIENGFELTGPIARGDWRTVAAHRAAIQARLPQV